MSVPVAPTSPKKRFNLRFAVFGGYILLALAIGELQPFTRVTMYDSFPNWAYVFYLKDGQGNVIFFNKNLGSTIQAGSLAHMFYSYCHGKNIIYGYGQEDEAQLLEAGNYLAEHVREAWPESHPKPDEIFVQRKHLHYDANNRFVEDDKTIGHALFKTND